MLKSIVRYVKDTLKIGLKGNFSYLRNDMKRYAAGEGSFAGIPKSNIVDRERALQKVMAWLLYAQEAMNDMGFGSFHLAHGWSSSYPETTGYIIPTLINYGAESEDELYMHAAIQAADFLVSLQKPSGGWQGGRVDDHKPEIVFNTGQIIRGMLAVYFHTGEEKYIHAAAKGGDWLCSIQHEEGYWKEHALMDAARVYDAFVDAPLISLYNTIGKEEYRHAAEKNLKWILNEKMQANGWFVDCDNTIKHNDRPILHTIAYTLDGLLESDELMMDGRYFDAALIGATVLKDQFLQVGRLYGRYDNQWKGSEYFLCTGAAQMAIVWLRLYENTGEKTFLHAADRALDILIFIQQRKIKEKPASLGAIPGSFPIWGRYEPFAFPNWASKFFADALMMRSQIDE